MGDLWIATFEEIARYDHLTDDFTRFQKRDTSEYPTIDALTFEEDLRGRLWVGTLHGLFLVDKEKGDLVRWVTGDFKTFRDREVNDLLFDEQGVWLACSDGLFRSHDLNEGQVTSISQLGHIPPSVGIVDVDRDEKGGVWMAARGEGLGYLQKSGLGYTTKWYDAGMRAQSVIDVHVDSQQRLWVGTESGGLKLYDTANDKFRSFVNDPEDPTTLRSNSIWKIFEDNRGRLWLGSNNQGFFLHDPWSKKFDVLTPGGGKNVRLKFGTVSSFHETDEDLWIGTDGGGISIWDRSEGTFTFKGYDEKDPNSLSGDAVLCLFEDSQDRVWVGTWANGLNRYDPKSGGFEKFRQIDDRPSIASNNIFDIDEDDQGRLWLATWGHGISRYDPRTGTYFEVGHVKYSDKYLSSHQTYDVEVDDVTGALWVGTVFGLDKLDFFDDDSFTISHYHPDPEVGDFLSGDFIQCIFEDSQHRIWVGTSHGLNLYDRDTDEFRAFYQKDGIASNEIRAIIEDQNGIFWVSTDNGLTKMTFEDGDWVFATFDQADGLQSKEFFRNARFISRSGELFFGGVKGFNYFKPEDIVPDLDPPTLKIKDVSVFNQSIQEDSGFVLSRSI
ncbi:MAG: two-component regulator propeller domain-containing protein, partial [Bacteroidota bacterium]